jgi:GDP-L-fucose synthase
VDDMAAASVFVMELDKKKYNEHTEPMQSHINVGFGSDVTIAELAKAVSNEVGYEGKISFNVSKMDGAPRKWMDSSRLNQLGWSAKVGLDEGLKASYLDFLANNALRKLKKQD